MVSNSFVFCFLCFVLVFFGQETCALKKGDVGTCVGKVSSIVKKQVAYWVTGRCRNSRNICRARRWKTVPSMKWTTGTICCEGWQHDGEQDACKPICSLGCLRGRCTAPETCHCDPPLYLDPGRNYICRTPAVCTPSCVNALCVHKQTEPTSKEQEDTPTCQCLDSTRRYNDTHCAYCDHDHKINPDLTCSSICEPPCLNGACVGNKCQCFDGYQFKNGTCEPVCEGCVNSVCMEPNKCVCLEGFSAVNNTHCVLLNSTCECENGECVTGECVCRDGYVLKDGVCEPVCEVCVNGLCVAPGVCECYEGYSGSGAAGVCCRPECGDSCDARGECPMRACVLRRCRHKNGCKNEKQNKTDGSTISSTLGCCNHWKYNAEEERCDPICLLGCFNGTCIAPDTCDCLPGYVELNDTACTPHCDSPCSHGVCTSPNTCTCEPNYRLDPTDKFTCLPICETQCVNASCVAPNTCSCDPGYERETSWQCKPVCDSCQHGQCIGPNNCSCNDGYAKQDGQCAPVCDEPCRNGYCSAPNVCSCLTGFKLNADDKFVCDPICESECVNSKCISPNKCSCDTGYDRVNKWECKPVCDSCENGECVAPNNCSCNEGYIEQNSTCTPVCDHPCVNGYCSKPNGCSCHDGFKLNLHNKFTCDPICDPECENATCISPGVCFCDAGYEPENKWKCKAYCENCDNGVCMAPNECSCNEGFTLEAGRCVPVCKTCQNGRCVAPDKCDCFDGYALNNITSQCDPICDSACINSKCISPNNCQCFDGYTETRNRFTCSPVCESCEHGTCVAPYTCSCHEGYTSINGSCSPVCIDSCQNGNCTAPNTCTCFEGYVKKGARDNVCYKTCDGPCQNGFCNEYGVCECYTGFVMRNDTGCQPVEQVDCDSCQGNCSDNGYCFCQDGRPCYTASPASDEINTSASLAGLEWSWVLGGVVGLLLISIMLVVIQRTWVRRQRLDKHMDDQKKVASVMYQAVIPDALINSRVGEDEENRADYFSDAKDIGAKDSSTRVDVEDEHELSMS